MQISMWTRMIVLKKFQLGAMTLLAVEIQTISVSVWQKKKSTICPCLESFLENKLKSSRLIWQ